MSETPRFNEEVGDREFMENNLEASGTGNSDTPSSEQEYNGPTPDEPDEEETEEDDDE